MPGNKTDKKKSQSIQVLPPKVKLPQYTNKKENNKLTPSSSNNYKRTNNFKQKHTDPIKNKSYKLNEDKVGLPPSPKLIPTPDLKPNNTVIQISKRNSQSSLPSAATAAEKKSITSVTGDIKSNKAETGSISILNPKQNVKDTKKQLLQPPGAAAALGSVASVAGAGRRPTMGKYSLEIQEMNESFQPFKIRSKSISPHATAHPERERELRIHSNRGVQSHHPQYANPNTSGHNYALDNNVLPEKTGTAIAGAVGAAGNTRRRQTTGGKNLKTPSKKSPAQTDSSSNTSESSTILKTGNKKPFAKNKKWKLSKNFQKASKKQKPLIKPKSKIDFHHEDTVKFYIPHEDSYNNEMDKCEFGLEIFLHADLLWLELSPLFEEEHKAIEHAPKPKTHEIPQNFYDYDVFDESEQKIIICLPEYYGRESEDVDVNVDEDVLIAVQRRHSSRFSSGSALSMSPSSIMPHHTGPPNEFLCQTAIGKDVCLITYESVPNPKQSSWYDNRPVRIMKLHILRDGTNMGIVTQIGTRIVVTNALNIEIIEVLGVPSNIGGCCYAKGRPFKCKVFTLEQNKQLFGIIGRNGKRDKDIAYGLPFGFYFCSINHPPPSSTTNLYKMYILVILVGITTLCG